jgi:hypothetical protein
VTNVVDREIPEFENEAEEARWWFEHRDDIAGDLIASSRQNGRGEGSVARQARKVRQAAEDLSLGSGSSSQTVTQAKATHG